MITNNLYRGHRSHEGIQVSFFSDGVREEADFELLSEHVIDVYINDVLSMKLSCTPEDIPELVTGRLITEGVIDGIHEISVMNICRHGTKAHVYLAGARSSAEKEDCDNVPLIPTCCTDNRIINTEFCGTGTGVRKQDPAFKWKPSWIYHSAEVFAKDTPLHRITRSTHSAYLYRKGELLYFAEDIGRHNALDKAIGWGILNGIDLSGCYIYTSGRVPTDMMRKVVKAGIPMMVSKEVPTAQAAEMAADAGIILIGKARPDSYVLF